MSLLMAESITFDKLNQGTGDRKVAKTQSRAQNFALPRRMVDPDKGHLTISICICQYLHLSVSAFVKKGGKNSSLWTREATMKHVKAWLADLGLPGAQ